MKTAIVTGSDKNYFHNLLNLCRSLDKTKVLDKITLCIFSIDLDEDQIKLLSSYTNNIKSPEWDFDLKFKAANWKKLLTVRPFLRDYFTGFNNYIWLDADTNVLSNNFIKIFNDSSKLFELSIVPEYDISYLNFDKNNTFRNYFFNFYKIHGWSYKNNLKFFGKKYAEKLIEKPILNAGVFSMSTKSPFWDKWKDNYNFVIKNSTSEYSLNMDQASLNKVIYENINDVNFLNVKYNWLIKNKLPFLDENNNFFSTNFPFDKIEILHFTQININDNFNFFHPANKINYKIDSFKNILKIHQ